MVKGFGRLGGVLAVVALTLVVVCPQNAGATEGGGGVGFICPGQIDPLLRCFPTKPATTGPAGAKNTSIVYLLRTDPPAGGRLVAVRTSKRSTRVVSGSCEGRKCRAEFLKLPKETGGWIDLVFKTGKRTTTASVKQHGAGDTSWVVNAGQLVDPSSGPIIDPTIVQPVTNFVMDCVPDGVAVVCEPGSPRSDWVPLTMKFKMLTDAPGGAKPLSIQGDVLGPTEIVSGSCVGKVCEVTMVRDPSLGRDLQIVVATAAGRKVLIVDPTRRIRVDSIDSGLPIAMGAGGRAVVWWGGILPGSIWWDSVSDYNQNIPGVSMETPGAYTLMSRIVRYKYPDGGVKTTRFGWAMQNDDNNTSGVYTDHVYTALGG